MTDRFGTPDEQEPRHCFGGGPEITGGTGAEDDPYVVQSARCTCGRAADLLRHALEDALRNTGGPPMQTVELETEHGTDVLLYGPGPEYRDGGTMFIPAELLEDEEAGEL